jgi:hypothetical protein
VQPADQRAEQQAEQPLRRSARFQSPEYKHKYLASLIAAERQSSAQNDVRRKFLSRELLYNMTVQQGINKLGRPAVEAVVREMLQMVDTKDVFEGVELESLSDNMIQRVITSSMFITEKFDADGVFEKVKARLVAGGHLQDRNIYDNGSSPTPALQSVFMVAAIAAAESRAVAKVDFPGAFLNSVMPTEGDHQVVMRLNKFLTNVLVAIDPSYQKYVRKDGTCVVRLKKALYGCIESARLWYDKISSDLEKLGYSKNAYDPCVFNRTEADGTQVTIVIHVDDILLSASSEIIIDRAIAEIEAMYPNLETHRGRILSYLGMSLDFSRAGQVRVSMSGFISDLLEECEHIAGVVETPARNDIFKVEDKPLLTDSQREFYHSITAKLLYLGKRVRPDILTACAFLTKRVQNPNTGDQLKLERVIKYLRGTQAKYLCLQADKHISVLAWVDVSYGVHEDYKSHTACVIGIGKGPVYAKSSTQKLNTKSSSEAELVGLSDSSGQIIWTRNFLEAQGYKMGAATVFQDNQSTIALVKNGRSTSERTRHIAIRYFFVADRVASGEIRIEYLCTGDMLADVLTKPLQGELFRRLRDDLLNCYDDDE